MDHRNESCFKSGFLKKLKKLSFALLFKFQCRQKILSERFLRKLCYNFCGTKAIRLKEVPFCVMVIPCNYGHIIEQ